MIEKWKKIEDDWGVFGVLLTDLSKPFECIGHDLTVAKLEAYGFHIDAFKLIHDYLSNRKQRFKVNDVYSSWKDIFYGVPQESILGPLLFNIHLCNLFSFSEDFDIASYADDTTIYIINEKNELVTLLFGWFHINFMKANSDKSNLIMSCGEAITAMTNGVPIDFSKTEVLLGKTTDHELKFDNHVNNLQVKKASLKRKCTCLHCNFWEFQQKENCHEVIY